MQNILCKDVSIKHGIFNIWESVSGKKSKSLRTTVDKEEELKLK